MGKVRGSITIEAIVSVVIVSITFGISMLIFSNMTSGNEPIQLKAEMAINKWMNESVKSKRFLDEIEDVNGFELEKEILNYPGSEDLKVMRISAMVDGKVVGEGKRLVVSSE